MEREAKLRDLEKQQNMLQADSIEREAKLHELQRQNRVLQAQSEEAESQKILKQSLWNARASAVCKVFVFGLLASGVCLGAIKLIEGV